MTTSFWQLTDLDMKPTDLATSNQYDVVIVGAGIAGLSMAYWLEQLNPNLKIVIIDKGSLGIGASGRNAGFMTCGSAEHFNKLHQQFGLAKATEIWQFSEENRELLLSEIIQSDKTSVDFESTGSCTVAASSEDWIRYQTLAETMINAKIDVELINGHYLETHYGVQNAVGAIQYKHDGLIHPIKLLKKIKSKLKNAKFLLNADVQSYNMAGLDWTLQLPTKEIVAHKIVFCLNGYANTVIPNLKEIVKPQRGQIVVTERLKPIIKGPCYLTKHLCYFRQLPDGELLIGGFRNKDLDAENTNKDEITDKIQDALSDFAKSYFKNTHAIQIKHRWSGTMGFTPDGQMILGEQTLKKNTFIMAGCSGHGMGLSFRAAKTLAEAISGKPIPAHLDIKRFLK